MKGKLHPYLQQRLEAEEDFRLKDERARRKKLVGAIKEGSELRDTILSEVYPEWDFVRQEGKHLTYFRAGVSERKADAYADRSANPLLVVLLPNKLVSEDTFFDYFGMDSETFIKKVEDGLIIPQVLWPTDYIDLLGKSEFCRSFFDNWLENEKLQERPLLFANRISELLGGEPSAQRWKEKYRDKFESVEGKEIAVPALGEKEASEFLSERYGFFSLVWEEGAWILEELVKEYEKGRIPLQDLGDFAFSGLQFRASHILYNKGGIVTAWINDVRMALNNLSKVTGRFSSGFSPEFLYLWNWLYLMSRRVKKLKSFFINIASIKPGERQKYYIESRQDAERRESLKRVTEKENEIIDMEINKQAFENPDGMKALMEDLALEMEKLRNATNKYSRITTELAPTVIAFGSEFLLPSSFPQHFSRYVSAPVEDIIRGFARHMTKLTYTGFVVPVSVWQEGKSQWEGPLSIV